MTHDLDAHGMDGCPSGRRRAAKLLAESVEMAVLTSASPSHELRAAAMNAYVAKAETILTSHGFSVSGARVLALAWVIDAAKRAGEAL